jgi:hypothetical protein
MLADREMGMRTEKLARVKLLCFSYITNTVKGEAMRETVTSLQRSETLIYVYIFTADQCFSLLVVSALAIKLI